MHRPPLTLVSVDGSAYLRWQAELLADSHARVAQPGDLEILADVLTVPGDVYLPYNKPYAMRERARRGDGLDRPVVVLDPDMLFAASLDADVRPGRAIAQTAGLPEEVSGRATVIRHDRRARRLTLLEPPLIVHGTDLLSLAEAWLEWTIRLRADAETRRRVSWLCEMWALALAVADCGLRLRRRDDLAVVPPAPAPVRAPLVHYAWKTPCFDKHRYRPWELLAPCPHPGHEELGAAIGRRAARAASAVR